MLGSLVRPGRSTARPLHRCGALAAAHRGQEEVDRQGQEDTTGCSRLPPRGPLTWDLAARSGDRSDRSLRSFQACAAPRAAILTRKPAQGARRGAASQAGRGEGGRGRRGEGRGRGLAAPPAPPPPPGPACCPRDMAAPLRRLLREPCVSRRDSHLGPKFTFSLQRPRGLLTVLPRLTM